MQGRGYPSFKETRIEITIHSAVGALTAHHGGQDGTTGSVSNRHLVFTPPFRCQVPSKAALSIKLVSFPIPVRTLHLFHPNRNLTSLPIMH